MPSLSTNGRARTRTTAFPLTRILSAECSEMVGTLCVCRPASAATCCSFASLSHDVFPSFAKGPAPCQQSAEPIELAVIDEDTWFGNSTYEAQQSQAVLHSLLDFVRHKVCSRCGLFFYMYSNHRLRYCLIRAMLVFDPTFDEAGYVKLHE
jgi:hypothetical protein